MCVLAIMRGHGEVRLPSKSHRHGRFEVSVPFFVCSRLFVLALSPRRSAASHFLMRMMELSWFRSVLESNALCGTV